MDYNDGKYQYQVEITFESLDDSDRFNEQCVSMIEWIAENYGDSSFLGEKQEFFDIEIDFEDIYSELEQEVEEWQTNDLPIVEYDETTNTVSLKLYTESFTTFVSELAENYPTESIDIQELISDDPSMDMMTFDEEEYGIHEDSSLNIDDDGFDDTFDDY